MDFNQIMATCFAAGGKLENTYQPLREQSKSEVWKAILKHSSEKPINFLGSKRSFWTIFRAVLRMLFNTTNFNQKVHEILVRLGVKAETAKQVASDPIFN
jgi:hypothetical protein